MRAAKIDANHRQIRAALERIGWLVIDFSACGRGIPDLYAFKAGRSVWLELKDGDKPPSARILTPDQERLHARLRAAGAEIHILTSIEEAIRL